MSDNLKVLNQLIEVPVCYFIRKCLNINVSFWFLLLTMYVVLVDKIIFKTSTLQRVQVFPLVKNVTKEQYYSYKAIPIGYQWYILHFFSSKTIQEK